MDHEEHRRRVLAAWERGLRRADHPSVPLMPEDVRGLTASFGAIFNLWPSAEPRDWRSRSAWAEALRANRRTLDGRPIDPIPFWKQLNVSAGFTIAHPRATINTVRAMAAKHRNVPGGLVEAPADWHPDPEE